MKAHIITIGDEILIGQIVDSNSAWMAQQLNLIGVKVQEISSVRDDEDHILTTLSMAIATADIVLITGGLGPTKDDITKKTLAKHFGTELVWNEEAWQNVVSLFAKFGRAPKEIQRTQAQLPANATMLLNKVGTAPGMWFVYEDTVIVSMPGVPHEMMYLMEKEVLPRIKALNKGLPIAHRTMLTACIGESDLAQLIADIEDNLPAFMKLAYLPSLGQVRLRLTAQHENEDYLQEVLDITKAKMAAQIRPHLFGYEQDTLEKVIGEKLMAQGNKTLAFAESCTGGYLAHLITSVAGSSAYFLGSAVTYSNESKHRILGVSNETLEVYGAVSEQTVIEMAKGARVLYGADYAVSVSGIAGPGGGTSDKPVGTIWYAIATEKNTIAKQLKFGRDRQKNIQMTAVYVLYDLFKSIEEV